MSELRLACRRLLQEPGFAFLTVLTLALGIGANTAIFTLVDSILLRPLPYPEPDRLMLIWGYHPQIGRETASLPDFTDWRQQSFNFEYMAAASAGSMTLKAEHQPERVVGARVTSDFFQSLGLQPILGRGFLSEDCRPGAAKVVVISASLWERLFASDPGALGQSILLDGESYSVVGVAHPLLRFPTGSTLWAPLAMDPEESGRRSDFLTVIGRLRGGAATGQAQAEMSAIAARLQTAYPDTNSGWTAQIIPLHEQVVGEARPALLVLLGAVGFVLLIACSNVANLLLSRSAVLRREVSIRTALGATRARIVRQFLTEAFILALAGGCAGLALGWLSIDYLVALDPDGVPRLQDIKLDVRVLLYTSFLALGTTLLIGLFPALQAIRTEPNPTLKDAAPATGGAASGKKILHGLVVAEMALALILLVGAGLLVRTLYGMLSSDTGFDRSRLLTLQIPLPEGKYREGHQRADFYERLLERVRTLPHVRQASLVNPLPLSGGTRMWAFSVENRPEPLPEVVQDASIIIMGDRFPETLGLLLLRGRLLDLEDFSPENPGALINDSMARRYFAGQDPVGQRITFGDPQNTESLWYKIAGVVGDHRQTAEESSAYPSVFIPHRLVPAGTMALVVRTGAQPHAAAGDLRAAVQALDSEVAVYNLRTMDQVLESALQQRRFSMLLLSLFAVLALALAGVGLYGVMAYSVVRGRHEIGVRIALGADRGDILRLVLGRGLRLGLWGLLLGLVGSLLLTRFMASLVFGVSPTDPLTFFLICLLLLAVALLASYLPARRAARLAPIESLKT